MRKNDYYKPSDDTFLLAECLQNASGRSAMEIGVGSGYICELLTKHFRTVVATDIDLNAIEQAKEHVKDVTVVCCDSSSAIANMKFDLIVMNPPYLPSNEIKDMAVDGGEDGIEVSTRMIKDSVRLLHSNGKILMVASSLANYNLLIEILRGLGLETEIINRKKLAFEEIMVLQGSFSKLRSNFSPA
ncbi:MAG: HemK2/MTQ2 family protein methyltransferase [Nitrososphaerales archaeon]